jgi:hypothetical protein
MDILALKEQILEAKLDLLRHQRNKYSAAARNSFIEAKEFLLLQRESLSKLYDLKQIVLYQIAKFDFNEFRLRDYAELNELLLEFHPIEFQSVVSKKKGRTNLEKTIIDCWEYRKELYEVVKKEIQAIDY